MKIIHFCDRAYGNPPLHGMNKEKSSTFVAEMKQYGTILVVDDSQAILTTARICLGDVFERVITISSPDAILNTIREEHVDVVLLDMNFTNGVNSGREGMIWLSAIHRMHPDLPVVLVTAYADVQLAVRGLKNGAVDFVTKPWDNDELIRVLKDAIDRTQDMVTLGELEKRHIRMVVDKCHGNMSKAAEMLGITRQTLYKKYQP